MRTEFLQRIIFSVFFVWALMTASFAQTPPTPMAGSRYFNFTFDSLSATEKSAFASGATIKTSVDGDSLIFMGGSSNGPTRVKGGFTGGVRCTSVELPLYPSLGYLSAYIQNGSSSTAQDLYIKIWDANTSTWVPAEKITVGGNADQAFISSAALSKKSVKVKIESTGLFWFYNIAAWSSTQASTDPLEAPKVLSVNPASPAGTTNIPSSGIVSIQFDEIVKPGTGSITFATGTVTPVYMGNTLKVNYSNLTGSSNTLIVPAVSIQNNGNINMVKDTSIVYAMDITDPLYQSVSPADGSNINVSSVTAKIILTFNEPIAKGTGTITFGPGPYATLRDTIIGNTLVISYTGLAYSSAYTLTIPANRIQDISGNTYKSAITINYNTNAKDLAPPTLSAQSIADASTGVPIGGSIALTFNELVQKGSGNATLNGSLVTLSFNGTMAGINYTNLNYNTNNTVVISSGAITDTTGNAYTGLTFSFTTKPFASKAFDKIVAKDGSGDFTTIQAAITAVTTSSTQRTFIYVKNGIYNEKILIPSAKQNISLIGQDSAKTIITYNDNAANAGGTDLSYTIDIQAPGFYAENITIKNTWSTSGGFTNQAVALMTEGDQQVFKNCRTTSFQDTHYPKQANTRNYYLNCFIEGGTDFTFGGATAFFEGCIINDVLGGQYNTAPSTTPREFGLVYNNCSITRNSNVPDQSFYLGRPWKDYGKTVWLNTKMDAHIKDAGWSQWTGTGPDADNQWTGFYAEYNSMNLAGVPINPVRAAWGKHLTALEAARYNIDNVFNYGVGQSTWNPLPYSTAPAAPTNVVVNTNTLNWTAPQYAVGYVIFRNDTVIATTVNTNYTDASTSTNAKIYTVKAVNEYGAQSAASAQTVTSIGNGYNAYKNIFEIYPNPFADVITLKNSDKLKTVTFFNAEGQMVKQTEASSSISTTDLKAGFYMVKIMTHNGEIYFIKMTKP